MTPPEPKIIRGHCPNCGSGRKAYVRREHVVRSTDEDDGTSASDTGMILECRGCERIYFRRDYWFSEWETLGSHPITGSQDWRAASRRCIGQRQSAVNVHIGSRRLKRSTAISADSWKKCMRRWTTIFVYLQLSPRGLSLIVHQNCFESIPQCDSKRSWIGWVPTAE